MWYETHENMVMLAMALDDDGRFEEAADAIRYFEKPWKWTPEWEAWNKAGRPAKFDFELEAVEAVWRPRRSPGERIGQARSLRNEVHASGHRGVETMTVQISQADLGVMLRSTIDDNRLGTSFVASLIRRHFAAIDDYDKRQVLTSLEVAVAVPRNRFREESDREAWKALIEEIMPPKAPFTVDYHCHGCKARDVKLWRGVHGCSDVFGRELLCARCLVPDATVDADGRVASEYGRTDQLGGWLPAVPCDDTFWGYTSVPTADVRWWRALPTYAPLLPIGTARDSKTTGENGQ